MSVSDPPEVEPERDTVHTGIGLEAHLVCIVHAEPPPQVRPFKYLAGLYGRAIAYRTFALLKGPLKAS